MSVEPCGEWAFPVRAALTPQEGTGPQKTSERCPHLDGHLSFIDGTCVLCGKTAAALTPQEPRCPTCGSDDRGRRDRFVLSYPDLYGLTDIAPGTELTCVNGAWHALTPQEPPA